jgi:hypothetical protein
MVNHIVNYTEPRKRAYAELVNRREAEQIAARLTRRHPSRTNYQWFVREGSDGECVVVKVGVPAGKLVDPLKATTEAKPEPAQAEDPRPVLWKDVGGPYAG